MAGLFLRERPSPKITVVVPTHQRANLLPRVLSSLERQTLADFEVVVVNDGSTDSTRQFLESWSDRRVRGIHQKNRGRSAARNRGAKEAESELVTFLDSDDEAKPEWLESLVTGFREPNVGAVCCGIEVRAGGQGSGSERRISLPKDLGPVYGGVEALFLTGTVAFRRSLFLEVGGYAEDLAYGENTELAHRLLRRCRDRGLKVVSVPEPLVVFHQDRSALGVEAYRDRLAAARTILDRHGGRYRRFKPCAYARYHAIVGVNLVRLGRVSEARGSFFAALRACPRRTVHWGRLVLSMVPAVARRFWPPGQEEG